MKDTKDQSFSNSTYLKHPYTKAFTIWLLTLIVLGFAGWAGEFSINNWEITSKSRYLIQAFIMSGILVPVIWLMTRKYDLNLMDQVGFQGIIKASSWFIFGIAMIFLPMIITLGATHFFGWGKLTFNDSLSIVPTLSIGIITVFLYEALPEELAFRGFIFSQLNSKHKTWVAAIISVLLFVLLPIVLYPIQLLILNEEFNIGSSTSLSVSYLLVMLIFGSIVQYLRILTKSTWTGIGFHMAFVYMDRLVGIGPNDLIQITDVTNERAPQLTLLILMTIILISSILWLLRRKKLMSMRMD